MNKIKNWKYIIWGSSQLISLALNMNNVSLHMLNYAHMNNYSTETAVSRSQTDVHTIKSVLAPKN